MASTYIYRTPSSNGNLDKWTLSVWVKRCNLTSGSSAQYIASAGTASIQNTVYFDNNDRLIIEYYKADVGNYYKKTNKVFRDTSAWYHIVAVWDTGNATAEDRMRLYVNNERQTSWQSSADPGQNLDGFWNSTSYANNIGQLSGGTSRFDGLMSHLHFVDGTVYTPSTFGETDSTSGIWVPKTSPSVTYGTNGFFLKFENSGNMDLDSSGNNLTFTTSGTLTQNIDTPTHNFATLNPNSSISNLTYANGNLQVTGVGSSVWKTTFSSIGMMYGKAGKFYCEMKVSSLDSQAGIGVWGQPISVLTTSNFFPNHHQYGFVYKEDGSVSDDSQTFYTGSSFTSGDIVQCALDLTNSKIYFGKNGTWQNSGDPTSGSTGTGAVALENNGDAYFFTASSYGTDVLQMNFGQGYFGTTAVASAGSNASGIGTFEYDVPAGYTALSTKGLDI
tara:strand:+ start:450 stop:1784 length:1335 start_codon:yes stop_codon:yes gene_type:complete